MEKTRLTLHEELCKVLGSQNCYFSPPSKMKYPCIKYERENPSVTHADNDEYRCVERWMVTVIDPNPDSDIPKKLKDRFKTYCSKSREYPADGLYHFVYTLYW